jgi:hypothetical protein
VSFETTLICDGCGTVWDGGSVASLVDELEMQEGRAFKRADVDRGDWVEMSPSEDWRRSKRHLAPCCVDATRFFDGTPVPTLGGDGQ